MCLKTVRETTKKKNLRQISGFLSAKQSLDDRGRMYHMKQNLILIQKSFTFCSSNYIVAKNNTIIVPHFYCLAETDKLIVLKLDFTYTNQCTFYTQIYQSFKYTLKSLKTL